MKENNSLAEIDELIRYSYLYDFYGNLLKENHRLIFEDYVLNNLSLGEIAKDRHITRQGVYDTVKRCKSKLQQYEEKLQLVHKFEMTKEKLQEIEKIAKAGQDQKQAKAISELAEQIYDMI